MGCTASSDVEKNCKYVVTSSDDDRQRRLLKRTNSKGPINSDGNSSRTSKFIEGSRGSGRETITSDSAIPNRGRSRVNGGGSSLFSSPHLNPSPLVTGRSLAGPSVAIAERRGSIGRFADVPSPEEMNQRITASVERARVLHGIDGDVSKWVQLDPKEGVKLGLAFLGPEGKARILAWMFDVNAQSQAAQTLEMPTTGRGKSPPTVTSDSAAEEPEEQKPNAASLLPGQPDNDESFDMEAFITTIPSARTSQRPPPMAPSIRLTEDALRQMTETLKLLGRGAHKSRQVPHP